MAPTTANAIAPSEHDILLAKRAYKALECGTRFNADIPITVHQMYPTTFEVPASAIDLFADILREIANGNAVVVMPIHATVTTQEAANILNVSRPFLIGLLDSGKIPFQRLGSHRRIRLADMVAFKELADKKRDEALEELSRRGAGIESGLLAMPGPTVLYDACVLYPAPLRDLLMHLAGTGLFQARWTNEIHDEWIRNVLANRPDLDPVRIERTRNLMNGAIVDCLIAGYEHITPTLELPDQGDRHVLAAAIHGSVQIILTFNLRHFPAPMLADNEIEALHPDIFVEQLLDASEGEVANAVRNQRRNLKNPPMTVEQLLGVLKDQGLPRTVARLRRIADDL